MEKILKDIIYTDPKDIVFLCGAGISIDSPTYIPTVNNFILESLKECSASQEIIEKIKEMFHFVNYRFEALVHSINKMCDKDLKLSQLFSSKSFNKVHFFLSKMLENGSCILTTNFDNCIENAIAFNNDEYLLKKRYVYEGFDLSKSITDFSNCLIKIHGSQPLNNSQNTELVISIAALAKTSNAFSNFPYWKQSLLNMLKDKTVVVLGYSCSDDFDIYPILKLSQLKKIIWLNYNENHSYPEQCEMIENKNIKDLSNVLSLLYFEGQLISFFGEWAHFYDFELKRGPHIKKYSVKNYIDDCYKDEKEKMIYCNEIMLNYELNENLYYLDDNVIQLQNAKARYRTDDYQKTIEICEKLLGKSIDNNLKKEVLYFYSSALYRMKRYKDALEVAKENVELLKKINDKFYYFTYLNNYTSILYVYAWNLEDNKKRKQLLNKVRNNYNYIIKEARFINIEAYANALWGLGDLERCLENIDTAKELLNRAYEILIEIGNSFAIKQIQEILCDLQK